MRTTFSLLLAILPLGCGNSPPTSSTIGGDAGISDTAASADTKASTDATSPSDAASTPDTAGSSDVTGSADGKGNTDASITSDSAAADVSTADLGTTDASADAKADVKSDVALTEGQCTDEQPCTISGTSCSAPGSWSGCGMCKNFEPACADDAACKDVPNGICIVKKEDCTCSGTPLCHEGCGVDKDCAVGEVCLANHHCQAKPCKADDDCPALFACAKDANTCQRKSCSASTTCGSA